MAIYRTGKASLAANGIVTGYGTKWRETLKLIRVGATIVFASNPAEFATIIEIVNDTELRVADSAGKVIPESEYVILLHDSLTVDGLAQDVAETLRYYQGRETEFAHFIDLIRNMDLEKIEETIGKMKEQVDRFEKNYQLIQQTAKKVEENAAKAETNANVASESAGNAQRFREEAEDFRDETQTLRNSAADSVDEAKGQVVLAGNQVALAKQQADRAQGVVDSAKNEVVQSAANEVRKATEQADRAKTEADRAASLADQFDASKVMLKDKNLSDLSSKSEARKNLGVDNIEYNDLETKVMTKNKNTWFTLRNKNGKPWGVYDNEIKAWVALDIPQGGTGSTTPEGARKNLKLDRVHQDENMTRISASDPKTELRIGTDDWYVYRTAQDSTAGYVALGIQGGGTGARTAKEARDNLGLGENATAIYANLKLKSSYANPMEIASANPTIKFAETDKPSGSPDYALVFDGGNWRFQREDNNAPIFAYDYSKNQFTLTRATFQDAAGTRKNLGVPGLTTNNTFTAVQKIRNQDGLDIQKTSDAANAWLSYSDASGKVRWRMGYESNFGISWHAYNADGSHKTTAMRLNDVGALTIANNVDINGVLNANNGSMELGRGKTGASYIDLHYNAAKYDYDARIICDGMNRDQAGGGNLRLFSGFMEFRASAGYNFNGGRATFSGVDGSPILLKNATKGSALFAIGQDSDGSNIWYVGRGSNNVTSVHFHNYQKSTQVVLDSTIALNGGDVVTQRSLFVNGSSVYVKGGSGTNNTHLWLQNTSGKNRGVIYAADAGVLSFRADLATTGATGKGMSLNGSTGALTVASVTQTSDERAKFWIKPVDGALEKVCALNGVLFSMHPTVQSTVRNAGVIAQDVQKVLPEAVTEHKTDKTLPVLDKNCQPIENPLTVDYNALSALYIEAIKELKAEVDSLKAEIAELKSK